MKIINSIGAAFILGLMVCSNEAKGNFDVLRAAGMDRIIRNRADCLLSGEISLNRRKVAYSLYSLHTEFPDPIDWAKEAGWREVQVPVPSLLRFGNMRQMRFFESGSQYLILLFNQDRLDWLAAAFLESIAIFRETSKDAPGRDPGDWPRPEGCKRILHAAGIGIEAAWYESGELPNAVLSQSRDSLVSAGWRILRLNESVLVAERHDGMEIVLLAERFRTSTYLLVSSLAEQL